jgi:hypothetical protein
MRLPGLLGGRRGRNARWAGAVAAASALAVLAGCGGSTTASGTQGASPSAAPSPRSYESFTSYPGWVQQSIPPDKFDFTPWTVVSDFGLWPTKTGGIATGDLKSMSSIPPVVTYGHKAGRTIIMAVGEQGLGAAFASAASPRYRSTLVSNIVASVSKYNFDGVDIDWEEAVPQNEADYVALISELRAALDRQFPGRHMYLSADIDLGQVPPPIAAKIAPYVDSLNLETFQDNGVASVSAYTAAGIPASRLLLGIGVAPGYYDTTEASVAEKVSYVQGHGLRGTLLWQPGYLNTYRTDPRLTPLRRMISTAR